PVGSAPSGHRLDAEVNDGRGDGSRHQAASGRPPPGRPGQCNAAGDCEPGTRIVRRARQPPHGVVECRGRNGRYRLVDGTVDGSDLVQHSGQARPAVAARLVELVGYPIGYRLAAPPTRGVLAGLAGSPDIHCCMLTPARSSLTSRESARYASINLISRYLMG